MDALLVKSGLYGAELVPIRSLFLVYRYNECLRAAGISPTALTSFDIDGKGWSPQIADEKKDPFYLSNGGAVQFGIILTPDQKGKPIYKPYYAFERYVLDTIFASSSKAIADLTSRSGVWLQIDPGVARFGNPRDLLLVESVDVTLADTVGIMSGAILQRKLVDRFRNQQGSWSDERLRRSIIDSASRYGDLRFRDIVIPKQNIKELEYFYAEVFGGTFTIRNPDMKESLLVVADEKFETGGGSPRVYKFSDADLMTKLFEHKFVEVSSEWYRNNPDCMEDLWDSILADVVYYDKERHGVDFEALTPLRKRRYINEISDMPEEFFEMEKFRKLVDSGKDAEVVSEKARMMLMRPHHDLPPWAVRVLWRLISRMTIFTKLPTISIVDMYLYDKPTFFANYAEWPKMRRRWAVRHLKERGVVPGGEKDELEY